MKKRHEVYELGDFTNSVTKEIDLGSFSHAWLYGQTTSQNTNFEVEAAPEEFGETPTWFLFGKRVAKASAGRFCVPLPVGVGSDYLVPARIRVRLVSGGMDELHIEGVREIS